MSQTKKLISLVLAALLLTGLLTAAAGATDSSAATEKAESVSSATGTDMRLMRTRGSVSLLDASGAALPFQEAMRLFSGYSLSTDAESLAVVSLDDTKAITVDENSSVTLLRDGRKLDLSLIKGAMYFSVAKPLDAEESFSIRTSTMVLGIRGTSGCVEVLDEKSSAVILTSGHAQITSADGEEAEIGPGEQVVVDMSAGKAEITKTSVAPEEYPAILLCPLALDDEMLAEANKQIGSGYKQQVLDLAHAYAVQQGKLELLAEIYARQQIIVDMDIITQEIAAAAASGGGESGDGGKTTVGSSGPYKTHGVTMYNNNVP